MNTLFKKVTSVDFLSALEVGNEKHCRYAWSFQIPKKKGQWRAIGHRSSKKATTKLTDFYLDAETFVPELGEKRCSVDCFLSPNQFWDWRNTRQLALLCANWLEIDTVGHKSLSLAEEQTVISEVFDQIEASGLPTPNGYVCSGSGGVHLYWLYEPEAAYFWRVKAWKDIAARLIDSLKGGALWEVDAGASRDPARVMRVPGTLHGKTGRTVRAHFLPEMEKYQFDQLAHACGIELTPPKIELVKPKPEVKPDVPTKPLNHSSLNQATKGKGEKHTIRMWWTKTYNHVVTHLRRVGVKQGQRDSAAFILFVALQHMVDKDVALERIRRLNADLIKLDEKELKQYLSTAARTHYKYRKSSLALYLSSQLQMDTSFLYSAKESVSPEELKERQQASAAQTAIKKARKTLEYLVSNAKALLRSQTLTQVALATQTGRSVSTVKRYWGRIQACMNGVISCPSIYPPQGENELLANV